MDSELYRQIYTFEWDQRSALSSAVNIPIVATTVLGGAAATMALGYPYSAEPTSSWFVLLMAGAGCCLAFSVYSIFRSLITSKYKQLPSPLELRKYFESLSAWHERQGTAQAAKREFDDKLNLRLAEAADANAANNGVRAAHIFRATVSLSIALVFIAIAAALFVTSSVASGEKVQKIRIINLDPLHKESIMAKDKQGKEPVPQTTTPSTTPKPATVPVETKPEFPPNIERREYTVVPEKVK